MARQPIPASGPRGGGQDEGRIAAGRGNGKNLELILVQPQFASNLFPSQQSTRLRHSREPNPHPPLLRCAARDRDSEPTRQAAFPLSFGTHGYRRHTLERPVSARVHTGQGQPVRHISSSPCKVPLCAPEDQEIPRVEMHLLCEVHKPLRMQRPDAGRGIRLLRPRSGSLGH